MTPLHAERLTILCRFMENLQLRDGNEFFMGWFWAERKCGTSACALGWATTVPALNEQGLTREYCAFERCDVTKRVEAFFGEDTYLPLFNGWHNNRLKTPQQWAAHCRKYLAEQGFPVKDDDGFPRFMDRVMVPVDTKETIIEVK